MENLIKCYLCNKSLLHERVIEGNVIKMIHPESDMTQFYISNDSRMDVRVCKTCKGMDLENKIIHNKIMKNIMDGWKQEQDTLLVSDQITQEQYDKTMDYHNNLSILFKSEGMDDYQVKARANK